MPAVACAATAGFLPAKHKHLWLTFNSDPLAQEPLCGMRCDVKQSLHHIQMNGSLCAAYMYEVALYFLVGFVHNTECVRMQEFNFHALQWNFQPRNTNLRFL
jgi:hypothetical protein